MPIMLTKGANVNLSKEAPQMLQMTVGLGWNVSAHGNSSFDLDAMAFLLNKNHKMRGDADFIFFNNKKSADGGVEHTGDNLTGEGSGDDEQLRIHLPKISPEIEKIVFCVNIHDGIDRVQNFNQVRSAFIRIVNDQQEEVARFDLSDDAGAETAMLFGELYRHNAEWKFRAIGQGFNGGLAALVQHFGGDVADESTPVLSAPAPTISLEKKIAQHAPQLVDLAKKATVSLEKNKLTQVKAQVGLVLDSSGSMHQQYVKGRVQEVIERLFPLAVHFDDDSKLECWAFGEKPTQLDSVEFANIKNYINNTQSGWKKWAVGARFNDEPKVIQQVIDFYKNSKEPVYILFISDGGVSSSSSKKIKALISDAARLPIFWQFVGIGGSNYGILETLDDMTGRVVDNCNFFALDDLHDVSEQVLYDRLLEEFPQWLIAARQKGILA